MLRLLLVALLSLLISCAPASVPRPPALDRQALRADIAALPGAQLQAGDGVQFSYPDQALFGSGAVLPLPGGTPVLDPLAALFLRHPGQSWQIDVRVGTEYGSSYDQTLAEKRSELLATYLLNKGVDLSQLQFQPAADHAESLVFTLNLPRAAQQELAE